MKKDSSKNSNTMITRRKSRATVAAASPSVVKRRKSIRTKQAGTNKDSSATVGSRAKKYQSEEQRLSAPEERTVGVCSTSNIRPAIPICADKHPSSLGEESGTGNISPTAVSGREDNAQPEHQQPPATEEITLQQTDKYNIPNINPSELKIDIENKKVAWNKNNNIDQFKANDTGPFIVWFETVGYICKIHPMKVGKAINTQLPTMKNEIIQIAKVGRNRIRIEVKTQECANLLVNSVLLPNTKMYIPKFLLYKKGLVRGIDWDMSEGEILNDLNSYPGQHELAVEAHRFYKKGIKGKSLPTGTVLITFRAQILPQFVDVLHVRREVQMYTDRVRQCTKCLRFRHTAGQCRGRTRCPICGDNHSKRDCPPGSAPRCIHCDEAHPSLNTPTCPANIQHQYIQNFMCINNFTYAEAVKNMSLQSLLGSNETTSFKYNAVEFPTLGPVTHSLRCQNHTGKKEIPSKVATKTTVFKAPKQYIAPTPSSTMLEYQKLIKEHNIPPKNLKGGLIPHNPYPPSPQPPTPVEETSVSSHPLASKGDAFFKLYEKITQIISYISNLDNDGTPHASILKTVRKDLRDALLYSINDSNE